MPGPDRLRAVAVAGLGWTVLLAAAASRGTAAVADPLADCERRVRAQPEVYEPYLCFHAAARASGRWQEVDRRLERLAGELAFDGWALLVRGHLAQLHDEPRALESYRRAAEAFAERGPPRGEILARHNLRNMLHRRGDDDGAGEQVERVLAVAERAGEPALLAQALVLEGTHRVETGGDLARAHDGLRRALALLPADASYPQRKLALLALANVSFQLGRFEEAIATYRTLLDLTRRNADPLEEATTLFNIVNARQQELEQRPSPDGVAILEPLARVAFERAREAGNRHVEVRSAALLAQLARARGEPAAARALLEGALGVARDLGHPERIMICLWLLAELEADREPAAARALLDEASERALASGNDRLLAYAWQARLRLDWRTRPRAAAIATARQALGAIEALAARQGDETAAVGLFGAWTRDYRWLAGGLLAADPPALDEAFAVLERMRARALLATLAGGGEERHAAASPPAGEVAALGELIEVQRRLLATGLEAAERATLLDALERRENELAAARAATAARPDLPPSAFAGLDALRHGLRPDEALLLYQLAPDRDLYGDFAGGSWALAVTATGVTPCRLDGVSEMEGRVGLFLGMIERRDGSERAAAARLWDLLLAAPLAALPSGITRLLVVPDGALYRLPLEVLAPGEGTVREPLGVRYEVAVVPSATALLGWRASAPTPARRSALVLADPALAVGPTPPAATREASLGEGLALGPLPGAGREGRLVARLLAPTSELLSGAAATERALARTDLGEFALLHVAAHAFADGARPERSAVVLAAADAGEDGLLQSREIADLPLAGRLVVLSACRTATGAVAGGEGPLSLARAFQSAGALAVVASRWALRDDEAERMVTSLYRGLAAGRPLGAALRAARREEWTAGRPAAAWAALALMGDPGADVLAGLPQVSDVRRRGPAVFVLAATVALLALVVRRRRRRTR